MVANKKLFVYATILNNVEWIEDCIATAERLKPEWIMITDAGSTDGTMEILNEMSVKYGNILITSEPSTRGRGRQIALDLIYNIAGDEDLVMYLDCDNVYSDYFVDYITRKSIEVKDMETYNFGLMMVKTSKLAEWKDLNYGEDWERFAHLKSLGVSIKDCIEESDTKWIVKQRQGIGMSEREKYYNKSAISLFANLIHLHKGLAYKNWTGDARHFTSKAANIMAHILAYPYYSYNSKMNNRNYVENNLKEEVIE